MKNKFLTTIMIFSLSSCSSLKDSLVTGVSSGAAMGASAGALSSSKDKGKAALTGGLLGAAVGGLAGYLFHKQVKKKEERTRRETLFNLDKHDVSYPQGFTPQSSYGHGVTMPVVESEWIETQVKGKSLVEGHRIWRITEESQWVPETKKKK